MLDCRLVGEEEPIRQGDVFMSHKENEWLKLGVILTADCDIAQKKNRGILTFAPLITLKVYLHEVWLKDEITKVLDKLFLQLSNKVQDRHRAQNSNAQPLSISRLVDWLLSSNTDEILTVLNIIDPKDKVDFAELHAAYVELNAIIEKPIEFVEQIEKYFAAKNQLNGSKKPMALKTKRNQLAQAINQLRSDVFFINEIPDTANFGFLAMLRNFSQINEARLVSSRIDWYQSDQNYFRFARLNDTYKYAISQQFGILFSRIGLPSEFEDFQASIIEDFCETHILDDHQ